MKTQIIAAFLFLATTTTAWAGNEGPQAEPEAPKVLIAQMVVGSGFAPDWVPTRTTIDIDKKGKVTATKRFHDGVYQVQAIAQLAPQVLKSLKLKIESTEMGELKAANPDEPGCMDAPSTTYYAFHADGSKIPVSGVMQCKILSKENATSDDYDVKSVLDGFSAIAAIL